MILDDNIVGRGVAAGMNFIDGDGFYPAICGYNGTRVKFVGFESVESW